MLLINKVSAGDDEFATLYVVSDRMGERDCLIVIDRRDINASPQKRLGLVPVLQRQRRAHFEARRCLCFGMYYFTAISSRPILCRPSTMRLRCSGRGFLMPLA